MLPNGSWSFPRKQFFHQEPGLGRNQALGTVLLDDVKDVLRLGEPEMLDQKRDIVAIMGVETGGEALHGEHVIRCGGPNS